MITAGGVMIVTIAVPFVPELTQSGERRGLLLVDLFDKRSADRLTPAGEPLAFDRERLINKGFF